MGVTLSAGLAVAGARPSPASAAVEEWPHELSQAGPGRRGATAAGPDRSGPITELTSEFLYEYLLAEIALQRGQLNVAAQAYLDLARRTKDPRIARRGTEVAVHARMMNAAVESARIWQAAEPESLEAQRALATLLVSVGRLDEAEPFLERALAQSKSDPGDGLMQLNQMLASNEDKAAVLALVRRLAAKHPDAPAAHLAIAQAASAAGDDVLALQEARAALARRPDWETAALVQAALLRKRSADEAIQYLQTFIDAQPKAREARVTHAQLLVSERRTDESRKALQRLTEDYADSPEITYAAGLLAIQIEDWGFAEKSLKRLIESDTKVTDAGRRGVDPNLVRLYLGQIAEEQKRFAEAINWYGEVQQGEQYLTAQIRHAGVIAKQGELQRAREFLQRAPVTSNQQRVQIILAETNLLREAERIEEAFAVAERALEKLPSHPDLLYDHAMIAERLDRVDVMEASLRKVIAVKPDHAHAYNALGYSLADRKMRLTEARELIEKALKLAPDDYFIIDSLGWVLYRMGDHQGALKQLQRAYKGRPDAEIAAHLGEVLWVLGNREEANRIWQEGVKKAPNNETLQKTIKRFQESTAVK